MHFIPMIFRVTCCLAKWTRCASRSGKPGGCRVSTWDLWVISPTLNILKGVNLAQANLPSPLVVSRSRTADWTSWAAKGSSLCTASTACSSVMWCRLMPETRPCWPLSVYRAFSRSCVIGSVFQNLGCKPPAVQISLKDLWQIVVNSIQILKSRQTS